MGKEIEESSRDRKRVGEEDGEKWVYDSSLDYKSNIPLRASTGVWKASLFIFAIEFSERLCYFGISANLITYLTKVLHMNLKTSVRNVNYWTGVTTIMPLVGGFLADSYTGRFPMILFSSMAYLMGLILAAMSQFVPSLKPCRVNGCLHSRKVHEVVFFLTMYLISIGTGGHKPSLESFGGDQFDDDHLQERKKKMSYFNCWNFAVCCGFLLGVTVIVYLQDNAGWGVANLVLVVTMAITIIIFYSGRPYYRYRVPEGSPFTPMLQVMVAAIKKRNLTHPSTPDLLYEVPNSQKSHGRLLSHTNTFRFLDKAAIIEGNEIFSSSSQKNQSPWRLVTVTKVEELKLVLNMIPIWSSSLMFGVYVAQPPTFFVKQSNTMNRKIGNDFKIPPASIYALTAIGMIIAVAIYEKILDPMIRRSTGKERGIKILHRIGIGMVVSILAMSVAALVERKRLKASMPLSVFWLAPQFVMIGIADAFTLVGLQEYFYDQVPDSMRSLGMALYLSVIGVGNFLSSFLITVVDHMTEKKGSSWFGKDLNESRLDNFYWLLAAMSGVNLCIYMFLANRYTYKIVQRSVIVRDFHTSNPTKDHSLA